jgi:farnesyl diphosphate synthase
VSVGVPSGAASAPANQMVKTLQTTPAAPFSPFDAPLWMSTRSQAVELALEAPLAAVAAGPLRDAMCHAVLQGGKRLRPLLVMAGRAAVAMPGDGPELDAAALRAACAVELIHAYSLVHDDMPCMDNDVLRRGKPTVHVAFGEAQALLAGDALQALAFELLTPPEQDVPLHLQARLCGSLARAAGHAGMAGGQAIDLDSVGRRLNEPELRHMHRLKTGALLLASVMMGSACSANPVSAQSAQALQTYGEALGLAFQVVDDILDVTADSSVLGKTAGKDAAHDKPTYVSLMGLSAAQRLSEQLHEQALQALKDSGLGGRSESGGNSGGQAVGLNALQALAELVVNRKH